MTPRKRTAHQQLDEYRQAVAAEGMKLREEQAGLEAAKAEVEDRSRSLTDAYALEDAKLARERREELERAEAEAFDAQHRVGGAELRAQRAREELAAFTAENARALIEEREETANAVAARLTRAVAEVVKARRAYEAERQDVDQLVSQASGATTRYDGTPTGYAWERELKALERAYREQSEAEPPRPRWAGVAQRRNLNAVHRRLREKRGQEIVEVS
jgi:hypothetical protein